MKQVNIHHATRTDLLRLNTVSLSLLAKHRSRDRHALQPPVGSADELHDRRVAGPHSGVPDVAFLAHLRGGHLDNRPPLLDVRGRTNTASALRDAHRRALPLPGLTPLLSGAAGERSSVCPASFVPGSAVRERGSQDEGQGAYCRLLHQAARRQDRAAAHARLFPRQCGEHRTQVDQRQGMYVRYMCYFKSRVLAVDSYNTCTAVRV